MFGILRTLLAINVVLLHIFNIPTLGNYSISFFFLLYGFLMTLIMHKTYGFNFSGFKIYWLNRILRLYPIYFIIIIITIILISVFPFVVKHPAMYFPETIKQWIANISLLYPNIVPHRFAPRLSPPSWALTNELFYYLLISLGISKTKFRTLIWLILSIGYYIGTYFYYDIETYRYSAIFASSLPFSLGASLYWLNKSFPIRNVSIISICLVYLVFVLNAIYSSDYTDSIKTFSIYFNMILAFILIYLLYNFKSNFKLKSIDNYIGLYSYPIYLSHYVVGIVYSGLIGYGVINNSFKMKNVAIIPYFLLLIIFCYLLVHLIDIKINRFKSKLKNKLTN